MTGTAGKKWLLAFALSFLLGGCGESQDLVRKKLNVILDSDLNAITSDLAKSSLADSVHYTIVSYKNYSEGMYTAKAVVDFYFLKKVKAKITRKYRYFVSARLWDRYYNEYKLYGDSTHAKTR
jgi:hypothetical protein